MPGVSVSHAPPPVGVTVEVSQPSLVPDLVQSLRGMDCVAAPKGQRHVEVVSGWPLADESGPRLLDAYLHAWAARKTGWAVRVSP